MGPGAAQTLNDSHRATLRMILRRLASLSRVAAFLALFLACFATVPAAAQSISSILSHSSYTSTDRQQIESTIRRAEQDGIPRDMLVPRLQEGISRHAPAALVLQVLRRNVAHLVAARSILENAPGGEEVLADQSAWSLTATLLAAGVASSDILGLASASKGNSLTYRSAALLYGSLTGWGLNARQALQVCLAAAHSHLPASQYSGISDIFVRARAMRIPPARMVARLLDALPQAGTYEDLEREVLY